MKKMVLFRPASFISFFRCQVKAAHNAKDDVYLYYATEGEVNPSSVRDSDRVVTLFARGLPDLS